MRLLWSDEARRNLEASVAYIADDRPSAAMSLLEEIETEVKKLQKHPQLGKIIPDIAEHEVREIIVRTYHIAYRVTSDSVEIVTFFSSRQLPPWT